MGNSSTNIEKVFTADGSGELVTLGHGGRGPASEGGYTIAMHWLGLSAWTLHGGWCVDSWEKLETSSSKSIILKFFCTPSGGGRYVDSCTGDTQYSGVGSSGRSSLLGGVGEYNIENSTITPSGWVGMGADVLGFVRLLGVRSKVPIWLLSRVGGIIIPVCWLMGRF
jgi:hypothetical protein